MNLQHCLNQLMSLADNQTKMETARRLESFTDNTKVMDVLCTAAVYTDHHGLREVLLDVLKNNPAGAYARFSDYALWSKDPVARKHALMNLNLMGCRVAIDAVISGLYDPDASVRKAAAMSAGLYDDKNVQMVLEHYFETHRFELTFSFITGGLDLMRKKAEHHDTEDLPDMAAYTQSP
jgi:hypothetical protein